MKIGMIHPASSPYSAHGVYLELILKPQPACGLIGLHDFAMPRFTLPIDCPRVRRVKSFAELVAMPFVDGIHAFCWERSLPGDFAEVVAALGAGDGEALMALDTQRLHALQLSPDGRTAVDQMLADWQLLRDQALDPALNCIYGYPRDEEPGAVVTDVFSFHVDSAPFEASTYLCTYYGPPSEGLRHEDAQKRIDEPTTRAALLADFGGEDDSSFREYLADHCYDLHYASAPGAQPFSFGHFNLWRIATDYPNSPVPPCVHRAPATQFGDPPRLLLIS